MTGWAEPPISSFRRTPARAISLHTPPRAGLLSWCTRRTPAAPQGVTRERPCPVRLPVGSRRRFGASRRAMFRPASVSCACSICRRSSAFVRHCPLLGLCRDSTGARHAVAGGATARHADSYILRAGPRFDHARPAAGRGPAKRRPACFGREWYSHLGRESGMHPTLARGRPTVLSSTQFSMLVEVSLCEQANGVSPSERSKNCKCVTMWLQALFR